MYYKNEHGDMDQVALDFCDWWSERTLLFLIEMDRKWCSIIRLYEFEARSYANKLFGHTYFVCFPK